MDQNARADVALSRSIAGQSVEPAVCRDCGDTSVAWVKSSRSGRWYLAYAYAGSPGKVIPQASRPHFKTCAPRAEFRRGQHVQRLGDGSESQFAGWVGVVQGWCRDRVEVKFSDGRAASIDPCCLEVVA